MLKQTIGFIIYPALVALYLALGASLSFAGAQLTAVAAKIDRAIGVPTLLHRTQSPKTGSGSGLRSNRGLSQRRVRANRTVRRSAIRANRSAQRRAIRKSERRSVRRAIRRAERRSVRRAVRKYNRRVHGFRYRKRRAGFRHFYQGWWYATPWFLTPSYVVYRSGFDDAHIEWCLDRYRSYDPEINLYLGFDGDYHRCISPYS